MVQATSSEDIKGYVVAGGAGLYVGVGGAVSVGIFDSGTRAYIDSGAQINTQAGTAHADQSVTVVAANSGTNKTVAPSLGGGGFVGISGAVDVSTNLNVTSAYIGNSTTVKALKSVDVRALSYKNIESTTVSIAGGAVGIGGSVSVSYTHLRAHET